MDEGIKNPIGSSQEDKALLRDFLGGDKAAFDKLVLKYKNKVYNLCYWFLDDYQEANDAAQEIFIKVYRSVKKFRFESAFSTWLYRIAVNTCKNRLKSSDYRQKKSMVRLENPGEPDGSTASIALSDDFQSPASQLERKERLMLIKSAIDSLPAEQKTVVALRDIEGLSYDEIADVTGLNLGTVKSKLARARLDLREKLKGVI
jgi:RNA polymerase sigma-70 factor (ECF subfamily)